MTTEKGVPIIVQSIRIYKKRRSGYTDQWLYQCICQWCLQEAGLSTLTTASLVLATTAAVAGTPVVLEVVDFSNTDSTVTVEPIISAPTSTVIV